MEWAISKWVFNKNHDISISIMIFQYQSWFLWNQLYQYEYSISIIVFEYQPWFEINYINMNIQYHSKYFNINHRYQWNQLYQCGYSISIMIFQYHINIIHDMKSTISIWILNINHDISISVMVWNQLYHYEYSISIIIFQYQSQISMESANIFETNCTTMNIQYQSWYFNINHHIYEIN